MPLFHSKKQMKKIVKNGLLLLLIMASWVAAFVSLFKLAPSYSIGDISTLTAYVAFFVITAFVGVTFYFGIYLYALILAIYWAVALSHEERLSKLKKIAGETAKLKAELHGGLTHWRHVMREAQSLGGFK